jgi:hypothetical protein
MAHMRSGISSPSGRCTTRSWTSFSPRTVAMSAQPPCFSQFAGAGGALEQSGAEAVQDLVVAPAEHPPRRLVHGHDLAPSVEEKGAFLQAVEELRQAGQGNHRSAPMLFKVNAILTSRVNIFNGRGPWRGSNLLFS